jgi:hypothetical protein
MSTIVGLPLRIGRFGRLWPLTAKMLRRFGGAVKL